MNPEEAVEEAEARVAFCLRKGRDHLNLAGLGLTALPPNFVKLDGLRYLDLTDNQLRELPEEIGAFSDLLWLGLNGNRVERLPDTLCQLADLERLYLRGNHLQRLPERFGDLLKLVELDLVDNRLANLPPSFLALLERDSKPLYFDLEGNPGQVASVAAQGAESLAAYLREAQRGVLVRQGKLLLVGEGAVGKSTLLHALKGGEFIADRKTTHGLKVESLPIEVDGEQVTLNCWDFSGQKALRDTHQIFFTQPAIYLLVWNARLGENGAALEDWLWLIKHRTNGRGRVLIVATNAHKIRADLANAEAIKESFGGRDGILIEPYFMKVECDEKAEQEGLGTLSKAIHDVIARDESYAQQVPESWERAQRGLEDSRGDEPFQSWHDFSDACSKYGVHGEEEVKSFTRTQSQLGRLVWIEEGPLAEVVIINPDWLSKAIGFVLNDDYETEPDAGGRKLAKGILPESHMHAIWANPRAVDEEGNREIHYPGDLYPTFHRLMEAFDLSHQIAPPESGASVQHLIPNRLSGEKPDAWEEDWETADLISLRRRIDLLGFDHEPLNEWLARSFFCRLMVRLHPDARGRNDYLRAAHWAHGFRLERPNVGNARILRQGHHLFFEAIGLSPIALWERFDFAVDVLMRDLKQDLGLTIERLTRIPCHAECERDLDKRSYLVQEKVSTWLGQKIDVMPCTLEECDRILTLKELWSGQEQEDDEVAFRKSMLAMREDVGAIKQGVSELCQGQAKLVEKYEQAMQNPSSWTADTAEGKGFSAALTREMERLLNRLDDPGRRGPRLFSIRPAHPEFLNDRGKLFGQKFELLLHCERCLHPVAWLKDTEGLGRYTFDLDHAWWDKVGPYVKVTGRLLSWFKPMAGLNEGTVSAMHGVAADQVAELEKFLKKAPDVPAAADQKPLFAKDGVLSWLHGFLSSELDKDDLRNAELGLRQVRDKAADAYRWVHPSQASHYDQLEPPTA